MRLRRPHLLPVNLGRLTRDVPTHIGILPAGTMVEVVEAGEVDARICCDTAGHLTGRCHTVIVPRDALDGHRLTMTMSRRRRVRKATA